MIDVENEVIQAYDTSTTQIDKIIVDNQEYRISNVQYDDDCYEEGNIIGTAIARSLEFEIDNIVDLENKEVEYLTGIYVENEIKWTSLGNFIIQDVEPNDTTNIAKVTAMDYMLKTNIPYVSNLQYSDGNVTLIQVAQEVCNNSEIVLATLDFTNYNFIVDSNQFEEGTLNRQVIQAIAQISGTVAKIKNDNRLYFINPNKEVEVRKVFTLNNYKEAEIKRTTHPINLVSLGMTDIEGENITLRDEESISKNGENSLVVNDNPFAYTQEKREQLITALFNAIKGFEYKAYTFNCQGLPYLETTDKIQFRDREGSTYDSYVFRFNYKSPKGLESSIEAPSITKATVNYQNIPDALYMAKKTEYRVDKAEQRITQLTQETSEHEEKLVQHEQTIDSIKDTVSHFEEVTNTISGIKTITLENCIEGDLVELHIFGNNTVFDYLYPNNDLYPNDDLFPYGDSRIIITNEEGTSVVYELGVKDVLRQNGEIKDEYVLQNGKAQIIRRINKDGTIKTKEVIEDLGDYSIELFTGTNTIKIENYTAQIIAKYAIKNSLTDVYATRVEMHSSIEQTAGEINLEVSKKIEGKVGENEVITSINLSSEEAQINADKISLKRKNFKFS